MEKSGIEYEALNNEFRANSNPTALQKICDRLGPGSRTELFRALAAPSAIAVHRRPTSTPDTDIKWLPILACLTGHSRAVCG